MCNQLPPALAGGLIENKKGFSRINSYKNKKISYRKRPAYNAMMISEPNDAVSDTTGDDSSTDARNIKPSFLYYLNPSEGGSRKGSNEVRGRLQSRVGR